MIKITCAECGRHLEAPDDAAGKKGKCPGCGAVFEVPVAGGQFAASGWRMKKPGGKVYGPADTATMRTWIQEGRVSPEDMLAQEAAESWKPAHSIGEFAGLFPGGQEGKTCPGCGAVYPSDTVICTSCGINLSTGEKIQTAAEIPARVKGTRGRLALEGALAGAVTGAVVLAAFLLADIFIRWIFGGRSAAMDDFFRMLLFWAAAGAGFGIVIGIVTVMSRSEKTGTFTGLAMLGAALVLMFLASPLAGFFMLIGAIFWGYLVYLASSAISQSVMKNIRWEKYD